MFIQWTFFALALHMRRKLRTKDRFHQVGNNIKCILNKLFIRDAASIVSSSSSYSVFIRCCPLTRDGRIHPIPSVIACSPSLHLSRFRTSYFFKPIFSISSLICLISLGNTRCAAVIFLNLGTTLVRFRFYVQP